MAWVRRPTIVGVPEVRGYFPLRPARRSARAPSIAKMALLDLGGRGQENGRLGQRDPGLRQPSMLALSTQAFTTATAWGWASPTSSLAITISRRRGR